ncbi:MAG: hypothetical protein IRZ04_18070 [Rhodospirillales bacterium]|nr:hypothetical protein [Rhodospirillales bacterium]
MPLPVGTIWEWDAVAGDLVERYDIPDEDAFAWDRAFSNLKRTWRARSLRYGDRLKEKAHGWTFGIWRSHGSVSLWAEGRLAALADEDEDARRLAAPAELPAAVAVAVEVWREHGIELDEVPALVRRLDLTAELRLAVGSDGIAFLRALETVEVPGCIANAWQRDGRVETIYFRSRAARRGGGKVKLRVYDKGAEMAASGRPDAPPPGTLLRFERQMRFDAQGQLPAAVWAARSLGPHFAEPLAAIKEDAAVLMPGDAVDAVVARVESGELSPQIAERLLGTLLLWQRLGSSWSGWSAKTAQRRRRELANLGISLARDADGTGISVPVGLLARAAADAWVEVDFQHRAGSPPVPKSRSEAASS